MRRLPTDDRPAERPKVVTKSRSHKAKEEEKKKNKKKEKNSFG